MQIKLASVNTSSDAKKERVNIHSHIKGLGVNTNIYLHENDVNLTDERYSMFFDNSCGLIGQFKAREASLFLVDLIKQKKLAGKCILLAGPSGSGKSALAIGISREINKKMPFVFLSGSEVYSNEIKKTEVILEAFRKSIHIKIKDEKLVYEGEVVDMVVEENECMYSLNKAKQINAIIITLKTVKGAKTLRLAPKIHEQIVREKIKIGDVIYIETNTGHVKRLGRCNVYSKEYDIEFDEYVSLPKGEVHKKKEVVQQISLHDIDLANANPTVGEDLASVLNSYLRPKKTEITEKLRIEINKTVNKFLEMGLAEIIPGVLYIDEAHMLDIECFSYLNRAIESPLAPIVIMATNRGICTVKGTDNIEPHGISVDLLDRLIIVKTFPYTLTEIVQILALRAKTEKINISEEGMNYLAKIGSQSSLRFAMLLLEPSRIMASIEGKTVIDVKHIEQADALFMDAKTSAHRVAEQFNKFVN
ncbi:RuvB-like helicase [Plasmodium coatneyi]|uniref:RuvB-like helicase n=1 Tax=Plasmodium coatneyi TaxID=208452 RepID=A0A1B1E0Q5_9APIC|nr:RuvB-like helicase [Plasmodium coatneyi]ANQ08437.1 RuvB-like helicase [Plasmodium coatneyi]